MNVGWLIEIGKQYGPLAVIIAYVIIDSRLREQRYIMIIEKLSDSFQELKKDVAVIKERLWKL